MNKVAVLTSSIGSNELYDPKHFRDVADYHAFVDKENLEVEDGWQRHYLPDFSVIDDEFPNRRRAKLPKILPHMCAPGYDYYIWIDSTNCLIVDPTILIDKHLQDSDLACFKHQHRKCIYEELAVCYHHGIDNQQRLAEMMQFLKRNAFPKNLGLTENTCRIQRNTELTQTMGLMWWELICKFSSRDQINFPYVLHTLNIKPTILPGHAQGKNPYMPLWTRGGHKRKLDPK